jgi:tetratricopeptide (TPR) repeat protein
MTLAFATLIALTWASAAGQDKIDWKTDYAEALRAGKESKKNLILFFRNARPESVGRMAETHADVDVIRTSQERYIHVSVDTDQELGKELMKKFEVVGVCTTVFVTPDEEVMARIIGSIDAAAYLDRLNRFDSSWTTLQELLAKAKKNSEDLALRKEIADAYLELENDPKARESYSQVVKAVSSKKKATDRDKKLRADCLVKLLAIARKRVHASDRSTWNELESVVPMMKEADPDNRIGIYDDAIAAELHLMFLKNEFEGVIRLGRGTYAKYPKSDHADMLLWWIGLAEFRLGRKDDAIKTFRECAEKFPETELGRQSKITVEKLEKDK